MTRLSLHITRSEDEPLRQAQALAEQSQKLNQADRAMVVHLVLKLGLPLTPVLKRWAELDRAARAA